MNNNFGNNLYVFEVILVDNKKCVIVWKCVCFIMCDGGVMVYMLNVWLWGRGKVNLLINKVNFCFENVVCYYYLLLLISIVVIL